jgi:hypothetical protein
VRRPNARVDNGFQYPQIRVAVLSVGAEHVVVRGHTPTELLIEIVLRSVVLDLQHVDVYATVGIELPLSLQAVQDVLTMAIAREQNGPPLFFDEKHE